MAKSNYSKIIEHGDYLCQLVKPGLKNYELEDLGKKAVNLLTIEFDGKIFPEAFSSIDMTTRVDETKFNAISSTECIYPAQESSMKTWRELLQHIDVLQTCLRRIKKNDVLPWRQAVIVPTEEVDQNTGIASKADLKFAVSLGCLSESYSHLSHRLTLEKYEKVLTFSDPDTFDWSAVISHIFFDFLEMGGQPYYGICPRCDKLFSLKRKGRRKWCDENCKHYNHLGK